MISKYIIRVLQGTLPLILRIGRQSELELQGWSEIIEKNVKNGVVLEATSN